jgi:MSHA pilin protein MshC
MKKQQGFTLIELVTVMILVGIVSIALFSRVGSINTAAVQAGRDDVIAALFFAQQTAMMRSNIQVVVNATSISVTENGTPLQVPTQYPLAMPNGISLSASPAIFSYDKLGRTTEGTVSLTGSGNTQGTTAVVKVDASGYAYAN